LKIGLIKRIFDRSNEDRRDLDVHQSGYLYDDSNIVVEEVSGLVSEWVTPMMTPMAW
jgi:hypothetical protein